jgi:hypothetical protein
VSPTEFNLADATITLRPLIFFCLGIAFYAVFIFNFYRFLARKDIFELDFTKYAQARFQFIRTFLHLTFYVGKYLILFPFVAFAWFALLTVLLAFLAKTQAIESILLVAMAVLSSIRITAYYNEDLSRDLAKMLPFALLGVYVVDLSYFSFPASLDALLRAFNQWESITYYLMFVVGLEFILRISSPVVITVFAAGKHR